MHEEYYGFTEKPFSLTPDPKYLYKSESHADAFDLLQYAIRRREGFVVITGDIGTGKTTLCRAVLEQLDKRTFAALVLNPFITEDDLLRIILQDFGVVSRDEIKRGRLAAVTKQELIETLNDFLVSLVPLQAGALLIIDEAQNLPVQVLEQIRMLSNLETHKQKLLQIVMVGQLNLHEQLRSPELRQLDQRVSIRYELQPLTREETGAYVSHRLAIAGGGAAVSFAPRALALIHRYSGGIPRLINLVCDRALLGGYGARTARITPQIVAIAVETLDLSTPGVSALQWVRRHAVPFAAGVALTAMTAAAGWYGVVSLQARGAMRQGHPGVQVSRVAPPPQPPVKPAAAAPLDSPVALPIATTGERTAALLTPGRPGNDGGTLSGRETYSVIVGSFRTDGEAATLIGELGDLGYDARVRRIVSAERGTWYQVRLGPFADAALARAGEARIRLIPGYADARLTKN